MLRRTFDVMARASPQFRRLMMKSWYETLVVLDRERDIIFMNYGYSGIDESANEIALNGGEQVNRYCIQLYHHVAAAIDLKGKDVVEVGSGRGGGASYITRYLRPRSMRGIDFSKKAIEFCRNYYSINGLSFSQGDAENLPLADSSVDVIINLESSHCYGSMTRFLGEVYRVLRPDGYFLFSDHRDHDKINLLHEQLKDSGLSLVKENDITLNVVRALELDNDRKQKMIAQKCPRILRREAEEFAAMKGTRAYETFRSGYSRYLSFVLHKSQPAIT
ncbi:MAG TPA: class I SAM-dependent methyltransferase [Pyrinomonadaceae bacterium]|nr:class I SAM-dependent methyltransferase [Pyrinomonadaceae bacterium]